MCVKHLLYIIGVTTSLLSYCLSSHFMCLIKYFYLILIAAYKLANGSTGCKESHFSNVHRYSPHHWLRLHYVHNSCLVQFCSCFMA